MTHSLPSSRISPPVVVDRLDLGVGVERVGAGSRPTPDCLSRRTAGPRGRSVRVDRQRARLDRAGHPQRLSRGRASRSIPRAVDVSLASRIASASSLNGMIRRRTESPRARRAAPRRRGAGSPARPEPGAVRRRAADRDRSPSSRNDATVLARAGGDQRPHHGPLVQRVATRIADGVARSGRKRHRAALARGCASARSSPGRRCRTPRRRGLAAASRSASANTMLADLPPSSSETRLIVPRRRGSCAASVEPVKATWPRRGARPAAAARPARAGNDVDDPRAARPRAHLGEAQRGQRRQLRGFSTTVLPAASGAPSSTGDPSGKFHGVISADDADRLAEVNTIPPARGSCRRAGARARRE